MYEQSFVQEYHTDVDVLWVVDNSCSMDEEMQQVATNFASFIDEFVDLGLNYHLAVVTTDMDDPAQSGRFRGPVLTQDTPDVINAFLAQVDQGSAGSGSERGFDAVQAALSEPLASTDNAGFLREEAALAVIVLSDEDDDSTQGSTSFVNWFESLKPDPEKLTFSSICGDRGFGCQEFDFFGNTLSASAGPQYIDATDGFWASICTSDTPASAAKALTAAGMTVEFPDHPPSNSANDRDVDEDGRPGRRGRVGLRHGHPVARVQWGRHPRPAPRSLSATRCDGVRVSPASLLTLFSSPPAPAAARATRVPRNGCCRTRARRAARDRGLPDGPLRSEHRLPCRRAGAARARPATRIAIPELWAV